MWQRKRMALRLPTFLRARAILLPKSAGTFYFFFAGRFVTPWAANR
jgi:hypothetical protein